MINLQMVSKDIFDVLTQNWSLLLSFDVTGKSCSYFTNITKGLNLRESTGNINFENEESCKKIKENFVIKLFLLKLFPRKMF